MEFDQSLLFRKIYENEFGTPGGEPFGALIGDYEWTNHPEDIEALRLISNVSAAAFAPFISAADASLMGFERWSDLSRPRDLAKIFDTVEYTKWRGFRDSEDSRFVSLVMPRVLARLPTATDAPDRRIRLRGGALRRERCPDADGSRPLLLDERRLRPRDEADRSLREARVLHRHPGCRGREARLRTCRPTSSGRMTATSTPSVRRRSASLTGASTSCPV